MRGVKVELNRWIVCLVPQTFFCISEYNSQTSNMQKNITPMQERLVGYIAIGSLTFLENILFYGSKPDFQSPSRQGLWLRSRSEIAPVSRFLHQPFVPYLLFSAQLRLLLLRSLQLLHLLAQLHLRLARFTRVALAKSIFLQFHGEGVFHSFFAAYSLFTVALNARSANVFPAPSCSVLLYQVSTAFSLPLSSVRIRFRLSSLRQHKKRPLLSS